MGTSSKACQPSSLVVQQARAINPALLIVARAHFEEEIDHLKRHGANIVVMGEHEIAKTMLETVPAAATPADLPAGAAELSPRASPVAT